MIRLKLGVVIAGLDPMGDVLEPAWHAGHIWEDNGWGDFEITSGIEGNHSKEPLSGHYKGRSSDGGLCPDPQKAMSELRRRLPGWTVLLEKDHFHFQKKPPA